MKTTKEVLDLFIKYYDFRDDYDIREADKYAEHAEDFLDEMVLNKDITKEEKQEALNNDYYTLAYDSFLYYKHNVDMYCLRTLDEMYKSTNGKSYYFDMYIQGDDEDDIFDCLKKDYFKLENKEDMKGGIELNEELIRETFSQELIDYQYKYDALQEKILSLIPLVKEVNYYPVEHDLEVLTEEKLSVDTYKELCALNNVSITVDQDKVMFDFFDLV